MKIGTILVISLSALLFGCAAPVVKMSNGATAVKVAKSDPPDNYSEIGPITAIDGKGCGGFGYRGTYDRAVIRLKNKTYEMGGDYVQVFSLTEPHFRPGCFDNSYKINGTAFKKTGNAPSPLPITDTSKKSGADKLRELKKLLDENIITEQEYEAQKARILKDGI